MTTATVSTESPIAFPRAKRVVDWGVYRSVIALAVVMVVLAILTHGTFLTPRNLTNLTRQVAINGILAVGMTYVILIGGIDLSVGSIVALAGVVTGLFQVNLGLGRWDGAGAYGGALISIGAAMLVGLLCGAFNGWLITRHRIAPFIITLGMMVIARGFALILANGAAIAPLGDAYDALGQGYLTPVASVVIVSLVAALAIASFVARARSRSRHLGAETALSIAAVLAIAGAALWAFTGYRGLPIPVLIFGGLGLVAILILNRTRLGRYVLAIGGNPEAAWLAGVPIRKVSFWIYAMLGLLAGLSGAILSARLNGALPTAGELFELDAIAAVVIGGTSLLGGVGTVRGSILGAFFIGSLNNGMSLLDITEFYQKIIKGVIIILAVWLDMRQSRASSHRRG